MNQIPCINLPKQFAFNPRERERYKGRVVIESLREPELLVGQVVTASGQTVQQNPRRQKAMVVMKESR